MDIAIYSARNQVAHERILAATLQLVRVISIPESDLDIIKRIKAQDQDVHSLYQREAVAGVLESVVAHLDLNADPEASSDDAPGETSGTEDGAQEASTDPAPARRRKGVTA